MNTSLKSRPYLRAERNVGSKMNAEISSSVIQKHYLKKSTTSKIPITQKPKVEKRFKSSSENISKVNFDHRKINLKKIAENQCNTKEVVDYREKNKLDTEFTPKETNDLKNPPAISSKSISKKGSLEKSSKNNSGDFKKLSFEHKSSQSGLKEIEFYEKDELEPEYMSKSTRDLKTSQKHPDLPKGLFHPFSNEVEKVQTSDMKSIENIASFFKNPKPCKSILKNKSVSFSELDNIVVSNDKNQSFIKEQEQSMVPIHKKVTFKTLAADNLNTTSDNIHLKNFSNNLNHLQFHYFDKNINEKNKDDESLLNDKNILIPIVQESNNKESIDIEKHNVNNLKFLKNNILDNIEIDEGLDENLKSNSIAEKEVNNITEVVNKLILKNEDDYSLFSQSLDIEEAKSSSVSSPSETNQKAECFRILTEINPRDILQEKEDSFLVHTGKRNESLEDDLQKSRMFEYQDHKVNSFQSSFFNNTFSRRTSHECKKKESKPCDSREELVISNGYTKQVELQNNTPISEKCKILKEHTKEISTSSVAPSSEECTSCKEKLSRRKSIEEGINEKIRVLTAEYLQEIKIKGKKGFLLSLEKRKSRKNSFSSCKRRLPCKNPSCANFDERLNFEIELSPTSQTKSHKLIGSFKPDHHSTPKISKIPLLTQNVGKSINFLFIKRVTPQSNHRKDNHSKGMGKPLKSESDSDVIDDDNCTDESSLKSCNYKITANACEYENLDNIDSLSEEKSSRCDSSALCFSYNTISRHLTATNKVCCVLEFTRAFFKRTVMLCFLLPIFLFSLVFILLIIIEN